MPVVGKFAGHVVKIRHRSVRRDANSPAAKAAKATSASAAHGFMRTNSSVFRAAILPRYSHDPAASIMGSTIVAGAPAPPEPRPPTCKSLFWLTELDGVTNIADLLEWRTAETRQLCLTAEFTAVGVQWRSA
jgi:hypothetical protein